MMMMMMMMMMMKRYNLCMRSTTPIHKQAHQALHTPILGAAELLEEGIRKAAELDCLLVRVIRRQRHLRPAW
jgi:hypothetical protein